MAAGLYSCWVAAAQVPFRLTRMMVKAMEVSGIEGNFRHSCEETMRVLRGNKESVIAMWVITRKQPCYGVLFGSCCRLACLCSSTTSC
jgi:Phosphatidylinositol 3- and 4-kinase